MKLKEKIKAIPKKKLIIVAILIIALVTTVIFTVVASRKKGAGDSDASSGSQDNSVSVFKNAENSSQNNSAPDTVEPIDTSGVNGLKYVSNGNGTCHISGIGSCKETELKIPAYSPSGDVVTQISDGAFENCTSLVTVTIPATVKTIGAGVFRGCSSLVSINVDTENGVYTSVGGVLFSKDKKILVSYPMNRPGKNYLLPMDTKAVAAYAFEGALNMTNLLYEGSISEFQKIEFLMGNGIIDEVAITCNYVSAK